MSILRALLDSAFLILWQLVVKKTRLCFKPVYCHVSVMVVLILFFLLINESSVDPYVFIVGFGYIKSKAALKLRIWLITDEGWTFLYTYVHHLNFTTALLLVNNTVQRMLIIRWIHLTPINLFFWTSSQIANIGQFWLI